MGQVNDKDFTIEEDGTIVRGSKSSKVDQMKKKLSSGSNKTSSKNGNGISGWFILLLFLVVIGVGFIFLNVKDDNTTTNFGSNSLVEDHKEEVIEREEDNKTIEEFQIKRISIKKGSTDNPPYREFFVDYPVEGRSALVNEIRWWINNIFEKCVEKDYNQSLEDGEQMIKFYSDNAEEDIRFFEVNCRKEYETAQFVSYQYTEYQFRSGNAHGESHDGGATFRKSDGQVIDWGMFINGAEMKNLIKSGLNEYFDHDDYEKDFASFPECNPIFLHNGVKFLYDYYEVEGTSYAHGQPQFTIPYSQIQYQMKSSLRDLIE